MFVSYIALFHTLISFFFAICSIRFKFKLTSILVTFKYETYKTYFYLKLMYTLVSFILNMYYVSALYYRLGVHKSNKDITRFVEARREMSDRVSVERNFNVLAVVFFINSFHLL